MQILEDEKTSNEIPTLYVSSKDKQGVYFQDLENELGNFKVGVLPEDYSDEYIVNSKPGILALHLSKNYTVCKVFPLWFQVEGLTKCMVGIAIL
jgi:alpha,alpha-trehalase